MARASIMQPPAGIQQATGVRSKKPLPTARWEQPAVFRYSTVQRTEGGAALQDAVQSFGIEGQDRADHRFDGRRCGLTFTLWDQSCYTGPVLSEHLETIYAYLCYYASTCTFKINTIW